METPSSTRRVTRSQVKATMSGIPTSGKLDESEAVLSRQRNGKPERSALIDITNDSPITGLAMGFLQTPLSQAKKEQLKKTPGSGETLLRGQVKTLLQKVEEGAELVKLSFDHHQRPFVHHLQEIVKSPSGLLAPTPANTPNVPNLSYSIDVDVKVNGLVSVTPSEADQEIRQDITAIEEGSKQENLLESEKSLTRSLLFDFSEKSEISDSSSPCSSVLTSQEGSAGQEKSSDEDDASVWSIQVNASSIQDEDEEEVIVEEDYVDEDEEKDYDEEGEEGGLLDELCAGLSKISVQEKKIPAFEGKHTRFVYNSDDEIEGEEEVKDASVSPSVLRLKGMPTPEGKHLRFQEEEED